MQRHILIPLIVACALFMENLDSTVVATALPAIARSLGQSPLTLNVAMTSYLLSLAGQVYKGALYLYAANGFVSQPYSQDMFATAWKFKKQK